MKLSRNRCFYDKKTYILILPQDFENSTPLACYVCECLLRTIEDKNAWDKFNCCDACSNEWAYPNVANWIKGWRPSREEAILKRNERPRLTLSVNV